MYIRDTKSSNGTFVNDDKLVAQEPRQLVTGDTLQLGVDVVETNTAAHKCVVLKVVVTAPGEQISDSPLEAAAAALEPVEVAAVPPAVLWKQGEEAVTAEVESLRKKVEGLSQSNGDYVAELGELKANEQTVLNHLAQVNEVVHALEEATKANYENSVHEDKLQARIAMMEAQVAFYTKRNEEQAAGTEADELREQLVAAQEAQHEFEMRCKHEVRRISLEKEDTVAKHKAMGAEIAKVRLMHEASLRGKDADRAAVEAENGELRETAAKLQAAAEELATKLDAAAAAAAAAEAEAAAAVAAAEVAAQTAPAADSPDVAAASLEMLQKAQDAIASAAAETARAAELEETNEVLAEKVAAGAAVTAELEARASAADAEAAELQGQLEDMQTVAEELQGKLKAAHAKAKEAYSSGLQAGMAAAEEKAEGQERRANDAELLLQEAKGAAVAAAEEHAGAVAKAAEAAAAEATAAAQAQSAAATAALEQELSAAVAQAASFESELKKSTSEAAAAKKAASSEAGAAKAKLEKSSAAKLASAAKERAAEEKRLKQEHDATKKKLSMKTGELEEAEAAVSKLKAAARAAKSASEATAKSRKGEKAEAAASVAAAKKRTVAEEKKNIEMLAKLEAQKTLLTEERDALKAKVSKTEAEPAGLGFGAVAGAAVASAVAAWMANDFLSLT